MKRLLILCLFLVGGLFQVPASAMSFHERECKEAFDGKTGSTGQWDAGCLDYVTEDGERWIGSSGKASQAGSDPAKPDPETAVRIANCDDLICGKWRINQGGYKWQVRIQPSSDPNWQFEAVWVVSGSRFGYKVGDLDMRFNKVGEGAYIGETYWRNFLFSIGWGPLTLSLHSAMNFQANTPAPGGIRVAGTQKIGVRIGQVPTRVKKSNEIRALQSMSEIDVRVWIANAFDEGISNFTRYFNQPREIVVRDFVDEWCSSPETDCKQHKDRISITNKFGASLGHEDMVFKDGRYIGSRLHYIGIPYLSNAAHFELRKLRITHPKIEFHFDPKEDDEAVLWLGYDVDEIAKVLHEEPARGNDQPEVSSTGSGFVINNQGYVVTNSHVIEDCALINTVQAGITTKATLVISDPRNDLALLKMEKKPNTVVNFRGGRGIRAGEDVLAFGFPFKSVLSDELKGTKGMVNALSGFSNDTRFMQMSAPVQPGNSGGPLLDQAGNVVGVVTAKMNAIKMAKYSGDIPQNVNFALKASLVRDMLEVKDIDYETASSKKELKTVDIFDRAKKFTVLVECLQ